MQTPADVNMLAPDTVTAVFHPPVANNPNGFQPQAEAPTQPQMDGNQLQAAPGSTASNNNMTPASTVQADQGLPSVGQPSMPNPMPPTMDNSFNMQSEYGLDLRSRIGCGTGIVGGT